MIAFIPARRNSDRLQNKNTAPFMGRPLIQHAIDAANESGVFDYVVVNSDDRECLKIANQCGVLSYQRSHELAQSDTSMREVLIDFAWKHQLGAEPIMVLYPTYPLRTAGDVRDIRERWLEVAMRDSVSGLIGILDGGPSAREVSVGFDDRVLSKYTTYRTQDEGTDHTHKPVYCHFACVIRASEVGNTGRNLLGPRTADMWLNDRRARCFEVDTYGDFRLAEAIGKGVAA